MCVLELTFAFTTLCPVEGMGRVTSGVTITTFRLSDESRFTSITSPITNWSTVRLAEGFKYKKNKHHWRCPHIDITEEMSWFLLKLTFAFTSWCPVEGMSFITNGVTITTSRLSNESRFTCITSHVTNWSTVALAEGYKQVRKCSSLGDVHVHI